MVASRARRQGRRSLLVTPMACPAVGRWLQGRREQFVLATKCVGRMGERPWDQGASRRHILDAVRASLRRLGTDWIDLYQLHQFDPDTPMDETLEALDVLVCAGDVR